MDALFRDSLEHTRHIARAARGMAGEPRYRVWSTRIALLAELLDALSEERNGATNDRWLAAYLAAMPSDPKETQP